MQYQKKICSAHKEKKIKYCVISFRLHLIMQNVCPVIFYYNPNAAFTEKKKTFLNVFYACSVVFRECIIKVPMNKQ